MPNGVSGDSRVSRRGLLLAAPIGAGTRLAHAAARGRRLVPFLLPIALFLLIRYAYGDAVKAWFAADDFLWLEISDLDSVLRSFIGGWGHGPAWRPIVRLSFWADYQLFGAAARGWHTHNLALHGINAMLLFALVDRLSGERFFATAAALIFALLPLLFENTIWISGRTHLLGFLFSLLALVIADRALTGAWWRWLPALVIAYVLALLAYEGSVYVVPLAALIAARRFAVLRAEPRRLIVLAAIIAVAIAYLVLRPLVLGAGNLYPTRSLATFFTPAYADELAFVLRLTVEQIRPHWLYFLAAGAVCLAAAPWLFLMGLGGIAAFVATYAPFAVVQGFGLRFAYAMFACLAVVLAAAIAGLARLAYVGRPAAAALLAAILWLNLAEVRVIAREWRDAGVIGRQALDNIVAATPNLDVDRPLIVFGAPILHKRALIFFTYFQTAMRLHSPAHRGLVIPGHLLFDFDQRFRMALLGDLWLTDRRRRESEKRPFFQCLENTDLLQDMVEDVARGLLECGALFVEVDPVTQRVATLSSEEAFARLARGLDPQRLRSR